MDIAGLIAQTAAATQAIKKGLEALFKHELQKWAAWIISALVALVLVSVAAVQTNTPFNLALLWIYVKVLAGANGGFLLLQKLVDAFKK